MHKVSSLQQGLLPPNIAKPLLPAGRIISTKLNFKAMLLPKEKAKQIFNRFIPLTKKFDSENGWTDDPYDAQDAALIVVDIILNDVGAKDWDDDGMTGTNYWMNVKTELEAMV